MKERKIERNNELKTKGKKEWINEWKKERREEGNKDKKRNAKPKQRKINNTAAKADRIQKEFVAKAKELAKAQRDLEVLKLDARNVELRTHKLKHNSRKSEQKDEQGNDIFVKERWTLVERN